MKTEKKETSEEACKRNGHKLPVLPKCALIDTVKYVDEKDVKEIKNDIFRGKTIDETVDGLYYGPPMCQELTEPWNIYTMFIKLITSLAGSCEDFSDSESERDFEPETNKKDAITLLKEEEKRIKLIGLLGKKYKGIKNVYIKVREGIGYVEFKLCADLNFYLMVFLWVYAQQYAFINNHGDFGWDHFFNGRYKIQHYKDNAIVELDCDS
jgi:hypothetical protein